MSTHRRLIPRVALVLVLVTPVSAFAQDSPKAGLVMASSASVGVIVPVSDRVAVRPEIGFATNSADGTGPSAGAEATTRQAAPGVSVLFYTAKWDALRTYVSPRYVYRRTHTTTTSPIQSNGVTATSHTAAGSFGAEYALHPRFAVFGEAGISHTHATSPTTTSNSWSQTAAVGAMLLF